jgi:AcrR family transcriptional regulator
MLMATKRRPAEESRTLLIEAAADIINNEGYAALSARKLAEKVGLKRQIVHYYFRTMEELLLAVVHHYGDLGLARLEDALASRNPLRAIWETEADSSATSYAFMAMAKHAPAIRSEIELYFRKFRKLQVEAVARHFAETGVSEVSPEAAVIMIQSIAQGLMAEQALGNDKGHAQVEALVGQWIERTTAS